MTKISSKLIFFGSGQLGLGTLVALAEEFDIEAVITKPSKGHRRSNPVVDFTADANITCFTPSDKLELIDVFKDNNFKSRCGVVVDYGLIIPADVINNFELGIVNSHFSLLPEWRGADPISFSILSGQSKTGVSLMLIEPSLDTGPLLAQATVDIETTDNSESLSSKLLSTSNLLLLSSLDRYMRDALEPGDQLTTSTQALKYPTFSRKLSKLDGFINPNKPADVLEREVKAYSYWPKSYLSIDGLDVIITKAHAAKSLDYSNNLKIGSIYSYNQKILLITKLGVLVIDELKPAGKINMSAMAFLAGHKVAKLPIKE